MVGVPETLAANYCCAECSAEAIYVQEVCLQERMIPVMKSISIGKYMVKYCFSLT